MTINGVAFPSVITAEIERVAYFAADRFSVAFALGPASGIGIDSFSSVGTQLITIEVATDSLGYIELITGQIDNVFTNFKTNTVTLSGRDLSAKLIDTEIYETFANQTSSQIAELICSRHGLTPNVTTTSTPVGQYYNLDHARSALGLNSRSGTEWNLLTWLAMIEGFSLSVVGTNLNFGNHLAGQAFLLAPQNCISLSVDTVAALPTTAVVKSWNTRNKMVVTQKAGGDAGPLTTLVRPNLTSQQAMQLAQSHLATVSMHETMLAASLPGEFSIVPGGTITLVNTESRYDQDYVVDVVRRAIDAGRGFTQHVQAHALN